MFPLAFKQSSRLQICRFQNPHMSLTQSLYYWEQYCAIRETSYDTAQTLLPRSAQPLTVCQSNTHPGHLTSNFLMQILLAIKLSSQCILQGTPGKLRQAAPCLRTVNLSSNLLSTWDQVEELCDELHLLEVLNVSRNRLQFPEVARLAGPFHLKTLILIRCRIKHWKANSCLISHWSNTTLPALPIPSVTNLRI